VNIHLHVLVIQKNVLHQTASSVNKTWKVGTGVSLTSTYERNSFMPEAECF